MPACGSEGACLEGLWPGKTNLASPGSPRRRQRQQRDHQPRDQDHQEHHEHQEHHRHRRHGPGGLFCLLRGLLLCGLLAPLLWLSGWLCLLWLGLQAALGARREPARRCVLVSGGSTVQAVQLARNLSSAGLRVVVCELEGLFGLARFSRACATFYTVPRPGPGGASVAAYVSALRAIVLRERVSAYVPVSASAAAYYDGLAKPHLEALGCECLVPGAQDLTALEDPLRLLRRARRLGLAAVRHRLLPALAEAPRLYEEGRLRGRYRAVPAGPPGLRERPPDVYLPAGPGDLEARARAHPGPWLLLREPPGPQFLTCTLLRDSRLLANVTCRLDEEAGALVPEERPEVRRWLERFLQGGSERLAGHLSFRLAQASPERPGDLVLLGCRVGLGLPYLGHSGLHARLLAGQWRHRCRHHAPAPEAADQGRPLDKRQALLLYWDPLPYCLYCYLQLPFRRLVGALGAQRSHHQPPLAVVQ